MANASRPQLLAAVQRAIRANRNAAPEIVSVAIAARPELSADILRAAFTTVGTGRQNCPLLERILRAAIEANPDQASALTDLAATLAPNCQFGTEPDPGVFDRAPGNLNPPPGSVGGSGGQGNLVAICHNGRTIFVSPRAVDAHIRHGDTLGACQVTPTQNP